MKVYSIFLHITTYLIYVYFEICFKISSLVYVEKNRAPFFVEKIMVDYYFFFYLENNNKQKLLLKYLSYRSEIFLTLLLIINYLVFYMLLFNWYF